MGDPPSALALLRLTLTLPLAGIGMLSVCPLAP
jgi:hypothetical protein